MSVGKKIALTGLLVVVAVVVYRFVKIVVEVVREEFPPKDAPKAG